MLLKTLASFRRLQTSSCLSCGVTPFHRSVSQGLETKYSQEQKEKILQVINESDSKTLSSYNVAKSRLKTVSQWKSSNGQLKTLSDIESIEGFTQRMAVKLFDSILEGPQNAVKLKIKGQFLHPHLSSEVRANCKSVLAVYVTVNSVCWTHISRDNYEVLDWQYIDISYPDGKKFQITDIMDISWHIVQQLPKADIYVMKAEATTLRAGGSDPNNPKVIAVNLQKAQTVAMIVALINARENTMENDHSSENSEESFDHKVYFLRPSLPFRLYGTLVGNEKVSTEQTIEMLLQENEISSDSQFHMSKELKSMYRAHKDLQKDMLGHCLLLGLTFMDLCIYRNEKKIKQLIQK